MTKAVVTQTADKRQQPLFVVITNHSDNKKMMREIDGGWNPLMRHFYGSFAPRRLWVDVKELGDHYIHPDSAEHQVQIMDEEDLSPRLLRALLSDNDVLNAKIARRLDRLVLSAYPDLRSEDSSDDWRHQVVAILLHEDVLSDGSRLRPRVFREFGDTAYFIYKFDTNAPLPFDWVEKSSLKFAAFEGRWLCPSCGAMLAPKRDSQLHCCELCGNVYIMLDDDGNPAPPADGIYRPHCNTCGQKMRPAGPEAWVCEGCGSTKANHD